MNSKETFKEWKKELLESWKREALKAGDPCDDLGLSSFWRERFLDLCDAYEKQAEALAEAKKAFEEILDQFDDKCALTKTGFEWINDVSHEALAKIRAGREE